MERYKWMAIGVAVGVAAVLAYQKMKPSMASVVASVTPAA